MAEEKKKNIFDQIGNLFTNKDELAKAEEARKQAAEDAEQQQKILKAAAEKENAQLAEARKAAAEEAEKQLDAVQAEVAKKAAEVKAAAEAKAEEVKAAAEAKADELAAAMNAEAEKVAEKVGFVRAAVIATHTVGANETLSHIALHYYGHATPPYYKVIYEFNKEVIGDNMNIIRAGQVLEIPQLPQELIK
ncbi:MAG: hypothetical protein WBI14_09725 [Anaerolineaceae bacterium]